MVDGTRGFALFTVHSWAVVQLLDPMVYYLHNDITNELQQLLPYYGCNETRVMLRNKTNAPW